MIALYGLCFRYGPGAHITIESLSRSDLRRLLKDQLELHDADVINR